MGPVHIDGNYLEGGGQIVRTAVGLAAATGLPCRLTDIRAGRDTPGLRAQHVCGVEAVARLCNARVDGNRVGSTELTFDPGPLDPPANIHAEVHTAGSTMLVLQTLMIPLAAAGRAVDVLLTGGTHVHWAPTTDYFELVTAYYLGRMGLPVHVSDVEPGFYPRGGGICRVTVGPGRLTPIQLVGRAGEVRVSARSLATPQLRDARVVERQLASATRVVPVDEQSEAYRRARSTGSALFLLAEFVNCRLGASALGEKGKRAEAVGVECAGLLTRWLETDACLDEFMADQILPMLALAGGESRVHVAFVTDHCRSSIHVIERFLPVSFEVDEGLGLIECRSDSR